MPLIKHEQFIQAPLEVCFDLARSVDIHIVTSSKTKEKVVDGVMHGLLEKGDSVTWEAIHFGIRQRLTAKVTHMEKPYIFIDIMVQGAFKSFKHTHQFIEKNGGTLMLDTFEYTSPLGPIGVIADKLFLEKYMTNFITARANELRKIAENGL